VIAVPEVFLAVTPVQPRRGRPGRAVLIGRDLDARAWSGGGHPPGRRRTCRRPIAAESPAGGRNSLPLVTAAMLRCGDMREKPAA
jgi:hypothetical protein